MAKAAGIALATLKRFETGLRTPIPVVKAAVVCALEDAGVEFHNDGKRAAVSIGVPKLPK